jgi:IS1 transposase
MHNSQQNHQCKACGRQFIVLAENRVIDEEHCTLVKRLPWGKISLPGICRAVGVGIKWLMHCMGDRFNAVPEHLYVHLPDSPAAVRMGRLEAEADEMCSDAGEGVIPAAQHQAITRLARKTNHMERFNNTLRQRVSRLVRDTLAFSKTLANHRGALRYFICHDNLMSAAA